MEIDDLRELLVRWARRVILGHRSTLGYTKVKYSEMVGSAASAEFGMQFDPDIDEIDAVYRSMPPSIREVIWLHYVVPGQTKAKYNAGQSRAYFTRKAFAEEALRSAYTERKQQNQVDTADS